MFGDTIQSCRIQRSQGCTGAFSRLPVASIFWTLVSWRKPLPSFLQRLEQSRKLFCFSHRVFWWVQPIVSGWWSQTKCVDILKKHIQYKNSYWDIPPPPPPSSFVSAYMSSRLSCCYYSRPLPVCWSLYLLDCKAAPFTWRSPPMPRFYHGQVSFLTFSPPPNFSHCCILWSGSVFIVVIPKFRFCWPFQQLLLRHFGGIERAGTEWFRAPES